MNITFRQVATASGLVCLGLSVTWLFWPALLLDAWRVPMSEGAALMGRRGAAFLMALAVILLLARNAAPSPLRQAIARGMAVGYTLLATLGCYEYLAGHAGNGILLASGVEVLLAWGFWQAGHHPPDAS